MVVRIINNLQGIDYKVLLTWFKSFVLNFELLEQGLVPLSSSLTTFNLVDKTLRTIYYLHALQ